MTKSARRYDLDWWRVIAIFAVYLHHIGMPFNGDGFHIMNAESSKALDDIMVFFEQFRLPLLFLVSGVGTVYAFSKRSWFQFVGERVYRLLIPLVFGVFVIVPPQTFFENKSEYTSYWDFYQNIFFNIEVNHLWFIENLFYISICGIPLILFLRSEKSKKVKTILEKVATNEYGMLLWAIPLIVIKIVSKKYYPNDSKSIENLSSTLFYGFFFVAGIVMAVTPNIWISLKKNRKPSFIISLVVLVLFYVYYYLPSELASSYLSLSSRWDIWYGISSLLSWSLLITALGYGQVWMNRQSKLLAKLNEAIYPFYILHQTVIVIFAYYIVQLDLSIGAKLLLLLFSTFPTIVILYRFLVYPFKVTRLFFGMKQKKNVATDKKNLSGQLSSSKLNKF